MLQEISVLLDVDIDDKFFNIVEIDFLVNELFLKIPQWNRFEAEKIRQDIKDKINQMITAEEKPKAEAGK